MAVPVVVSLQPSRCAGGAVDRRQARAARGPAASSQRTWPASSARPRHRPTLHRNTAPSPLLPPTD